VWAAVLWSLAGTLLMALVGMKLPGVEVQNQRVEAAYRKELVLGEEDPSRASEAVCKSLFAHVKRNYSSLYFHFMYFNVAKYSYLQVDAMFPLLLLAPSVAAGSLDLGQIMQITGAFHSVSSNFQFLVRNWRHIVELLSIIERLWAFEKGISKDVSEKVEPKLASENHASFEEVTSTAVASDGCASLEDVESTTSLAV